MSNKVQFQQSSSATYNEGLRKYMQYIFSLVGVGIAITAAVSFLAAPLAFSFPAIRWIGVAGVVLLALGLPSMMNRFSSAQMLTAFFAFAAFEGISLSFIAAFVPLEIIAQAFLLSGVTFLSTALYGYVTKSDLTGVRDYVWMVAIGLSVAILLNVFVFKSGLFGLWLSFIMILFFSLLTAYETQNLKNIYNQSYGFGNESLRKVAIMGSLSLFINFINIFISFVQILIAMQSSRD